MTKIEGRYWVGAVNSHGQSTTKYHLFTAWNVNINDKTVRVVYPNFGVASDYPIGNFLIDSKNAIAEWGIQFVWILQDAENHHQTIALPLIHFIHHLCKYLQIVNIQYRARTPVHYGPMLTNELTLLAPLKALLERIKGIIKVQDRHEGDPLENPVFSNQMFQHFEKVCTRIHDATFEDPNEVSQIITKTIVTGAMKVINLIHERKNLKDEVALRSNTDAIVKIITYDLAVLQDRNYTKPLIKCVLVDVLQSLHMYKTTLIANPLMPFECWILSPKYEVAIKFRRWTNISHYLLHRIKNGRHYGPNTFNYWCGSSHFAFIFLPIQIAEYEEDLATYLPM